MARCHGRDLLPAAEKDRIRVDQQRLNAMPSKIVERDLNVTLGIGIPDYDIESERMRGGTQVRQDRRDVRICRISEETNNFCRWDEFAQDLEPLRCECDREKTDAGDISTRPVEAFGEAESDRVVTHVEDDGNRDRRILGGGHGGRAAHGNNDRDLPPDQISGERRQAIKLALRPAEFNRDVATLRSEGDFHGIGQLIHAAQDRLPRVICINNLFCHTVSSPSSPQPALYPGCPGPRPRA
jgi:hypothetical protein